MIQMVTVKRQAVAFCKYTIAGLLWLAVLLQNTLPVYIVLAIAVVSAFTGVHRSPLVLLYNVTIGRVAKTKEEYINLHSMRFAHIVAGVFCVLTLVSYYFVSPWLALVFAVVLALLQSVAACGYCSAQKLYECVICNSNCCRFGKKVRSIKNHVR